MFGNFEPNWPTVWRRPGTTHFNWQPLADCCCCCCCALPLFYDTAHNTWIHLDGYRFVYVPVQWFIPPMCHTIATIYLSIYLSISGWNTPWQWFISSLAAFASQPISEPHRSSGQWLNEGHSGYLSTYELINYRWHFLTMKTYVGTWTLAHWNILLDQHFPFTIGAIALIQEQFSFHCPTLVGI